MHLGLETPGARPDDSPAVPAVTETCAEPDYAEEHDRRILIVDDDDSIRALFASYLSEIYSCETAGDAQEALDILARERFALVISDIRMPGLGGIELLRKIVRLYPDTAVIIVSAVERTQRVIDAIRAGASDYLVKPCDLDVLSLRIHHALGRRVLLRNARRYKRELECRNAELVRQKAALERLQAQIIHSEKMASLGLMAAGVAHEINNPAGFILSNVDVLREYIGRLMQDLEIYRQVPVQPAQAEQANSVKKEFNYESLVSELDSMLLDCKAGAERIRDVVKNLRVFSRLDEAEIKRVDLNEGIEATLRLLAIYFKAGNISVVRDYGELLPVNCYAAQLNQVWMNLLVNAAQAIGKNHGEVRIKTRGDGSNVIVSVSDTGNGIPTDNLKKLFDPFFTTKPVGEGTGLGLSISHGIVKQHGGTIVVESAPGSGTTFTITLPIDTPRANLN